MNNPTVYTAFDPINNTNDSYVKLCVRTASPLEARANLIHAVLGIADETLEIQLVDVFSPTYREDMIKELGDAMWFTALYCFWEAEATDARADELFTNLVQNSNITGVSCIAIASKAVSLAKKEFAYGKPMEFADRYNLFSRAVSVVLTHCNNLGISIQEVLDRNIAKLSARYKGATFCQNSAINRDESKE